MDQTNFNEVFLYALISISVASLLILFYSSRAFKRSKEKNAPIIYWRMLFSAALSLYFLPVTIFFLTDQGSIKLPLVDLVIPIGLLIASLLSLFFSYLKYGYDGIKQKYVK